MYVFLNNFLLWLQAAVYEGQYHVVQETSEKVHFEYFVLPGFVCKWKGVARLITT